MFHIRKYAVRISITHFQSATTQTIVHLHILLIYESIYVDMMSVYQAVLPSAGSEMYTRNGCVVVSSEGYMIE